MKTLAIKKLDKALVDMLQRHLSTLWDWLRLIEQSKYSYSSPGKTFEKQVKTIEEQEKMMQFYYLWIYLPNN